MSMLMRRCAASLIFYKQNYTLVPAWIEKLIGFFSYK
jgi:hypothetical protein